MTPGGERVRTSSGGLVEISDVVLHHAAGDDLGAERGKVVLHPLDPTPRHGSRAPLVELGDDLVLEQGEEAVGFELVALGQVGFALR